MGGSVSRNSKNIQLTEEIEKLTLPIYKLGIVGPHNSGKTQLICRYADDTFNFDDKIEHRVDFKLKTININNIDYKLQIWDIYQGKNRFRTVGVSPYRGVNGVIIVSDITSDTQMKDIKDYLTEVDRYAREDTPIIIIGNKLDLQHERKIDLEEVLDFMKKKELTYIETSIKDDVNIEIIFTILLSKIANFPTPVISRGKSARK